MEFRADSAAGLRGKSGKLVQSGFREDGFRLWEDFLKGSRGSIFGEIDGMLANCYGTARLTFAIVSDDAVWQVVDGCGRRRGGQLRDTTRSVVLAAYYMEADLELETPFRRCLLYL